MLVCASHSEAQTRGRDPWVFRLVLEEKSGMLVCALGPNAIADNSGPANASNLWVAYNTENGGIYRVWSGGISFRGKVYDFGQLTSLTLGTTYHLQRNTILALSPGPIPGEWTTTGTVTPSGNNWNLSNATLTSPAIDLSSWDRAMLFFGGSVNVSVSTDNGATFTAQQFSAATGFASSKRIHSNSPNARIRFSAASGQLTQMRLDGDFRVWSAAQNGTAVPLEVEWRGHRLDRTASVTVKYDLVLSGGPRVSVEETPERIGATSPPALERRLNVTGLPADTVVSLKLNRASGSLGEAWQVTGAGTLRSAGPDTFLDLAANGITTVTGTWQ
jgi:hypothetical protein